MILNEGYRDTPKWSERDTLSSSALEIWWDSVAKKVAKPTQAVRPSCTTNSGDFVSKLLSRISASKGCASASAKKHQGLAVHWPGRVGLGCAKTMDCNGLQWIAKNGTPKISQNSPKKGIRRHRTRILSEILTSTACSSLRQFTDMTASQDFRGPISPKSLPSSCWIKSQWAIL